MLDEDTREEAGHQVWDMIVDCSFNGYQCDYTYFDTFFSPFYGNCFTFNSVFDPDSAESEFVIKRAGPHFGEDF